MVRYPHVVRLSAPFSVRHPRALQPPNGPTRTSVQPRDERGFTVIELIVVAGMLAVLLALSGTTLAELSRKFALDNAARTTIATLNQARTAAITRGHPVTVVYSAHQFTVTDTTDDEVIDRVEMPGHLALHDFGSEAYSPLGNATTPRWIFIFNGTHYRYIYIGLIGVARGA